MTVDVESRKSIAVAEADYRAAFEEYANEVHNLQMLQCKRDDVATIEIAARRVREAELNYRKHRDALAQALLANPACEAGVRSVAHALWERAGRPSGTAESDWFRAERMLQTAE